MRAFVLSNDPVPRMWLAADPFFGAATANETVLSALAAREAMFGAGVFSTERFLYEAVGTLYWLRWSPAGTGSPCTRTTTRSWRSLRCSKQTRT